MKKYIGINELAESLGLAKDTIYQWVNLKKIPYYKFGGRVRFDPEQIERWIKKREVKPHPIWEERNYGSGSQV